MDRGHKLEKEREREKKTGWICDTRLIQNLLDTIEIIIYGFVIIFSCEVNRVYTGK